MSGNRAEETEQQGDGEYDDDVAQHPPPEFASGCTALEYGVLLPEANEGFAHGAVIGRLVERCGQRKEIRALRGRLALRSAILRCTVLWGSLLGLLVGAVGIALLALPGLAVLILLRHGLSILRRNLWAILVGVRHCLPFLDK